MHLAESLGMQLTETCADVLNPPPLPATEEEKQETGMTEEEERELAELMDEE